MLPLYGTHTPPARAQVNLYLDDIRSKYVRYRNDYELRKFGCDLSHIRLMHRALSESNDVGIVLEDDAALEPDFMNRLDNAMRQLPHDWDVLYLRSCLHEPGEFVGGTVRTLHRAYCTLGYVYTRRFAHMVLMQMHGSDNYIDVKIKARAALRLALPAHLLPPASRLPPCASPRRGYNLYSPQASRPYSLTRR